MVVKILAHWHFCLDFMAFQQVYHTRTFSVLFLSLYKTGRKKDAFVCYVTKRLRLIRILANKNERDKHIQVRNSITGACVLLLFYLRDSLICVDILTLKYSKRWL